MTLRLYEEAALDKSNVLVADRLLYISDFFRDHSLIFRVGIEHEFGEPNLR